MGWRLLNDTQVQEELHIIWEEVAEFTNKIIDSPLIKGSVAPIRIHPGVLSTSVQQGDNHTLGYRVLTPRFRICLSPKTTDIIARATMTFSRCSPPTRRRLKGLPNYRDSLIAEFLSDEDEI